MLITSATPASAHAQLVSANPKAKSVLYVLPTQVKLMFDDDLIDVAGGNQIQVTDPKGKRIDVAESHLLGNQLNIDLKKSSVLGRYTVTYRVLSADGHPISASYFFNLAKKALKPAPKQK